MTPYVRGTLSRFPFYFIVLKKLLIQIGYLNIHNVTM